MACRRAIKVGKGAKRPSCLWEVSLIFLRPKPGPKKWRLIIDLRRLNKTLPDKSFHFEGLKTFIWTIGKNWWIITLDLKDGHYHLLMTESAQKLPRFRFKEEWYHYRVLPFRLSQAVWVFSKIMRALISHCWSIRIYCGNHVDDIWIAHPNIEVLKHQGTT